MNDELLEYKLSLLNNEKVILVHPQFGTVSHSFIGTLNADSSKHPVIFHFQGDGGVASLFQVGDVDKIDVTPTNINIVRLKSPHDYQEKYDTTYRSPA